MSIYHYLKLDQAGLLCCHHQECPQQQNGQKDIIKVECPVDMLDLDILGFIDHNITVNIIKNGEIVDKKKAAPSKTDRQCDQMSRIPAASHRSSTDWIRSLSFQ